MVGPSDVRNLLQVEILEQLVSDKTKLSCASPHMGEATVKMLKRKRSLVHVPRLGIR
jgi:hypothetical protein